MLMIIFWVFLEIMVLVKLFVVFLLDNLLIVLVFCKFILILCNSFVVGVLL